MILLWRDPEGNTISVTTGSNGVSAQNKYSEQMQRIVTLEKSITEKNNEITKLINEINALKVVSFMIKLLAWTK